MSYQFAHHTELANVMATYDFARVHRQALDEARRKCVRVLHELFEQYLHFKLGKKGLLREADGGIRPKTVKAWVQTYDQMFNVRYSTDIERAARRKKLRRRKA